MSNEISYEDGRLVVTRIFDAPREAVFRAWIEESQVELWWGCADAIRVQSTIEPKLAGKFSHRMTLQNSGDYLHHGIITEYDPPALLAYELIDSFHNTKMYVRVEFTEESSQTRVRLTQENLPDIYSQFVMAGWSAGFDKLAQLLLETQLSYEPL